MRRDQLAHILRAASQIAEDPDVLVIGSQAILGSFDEDDLPPEATMSAEADLAFLDDPDRVKADMVEGAIGELSAFHETNGVYAEGIHVSTAQLPNGWRQRVHGWPLESSQPARAWFIERHDLAASKLMAGRPKDISFVLALIRRGLVDTQQIEERLADMPAGADPRSIIRARQHLANESRQRK